MRASKKHDKILREFLDSYGITGKPNMAEVFQILLNENKVHISNVPFDYTAVIFDLLSFYGDGLKHLNIEMIADIYLKFLSKVESIQYEFPPKIERILSQNPKLKHLLTFSQELNSTPSSKISSLPIQNYLQKIISTPKREYLKIQKLEKIENNENLHNLSDSQLLSFRILTLYESFRYLFGFLLFLIDHIVGNQVKPIEKYLKSIRNVNSDFYKINHNNGRHWRRDIPDLKTYFSANYTNIGTVLDYLMNNKTFRNFAAHRFRDVQQTEIHQGIVHTDFGQTYSLEELEQSYYNLIGIWNLFNYSLHFLVSLLNEKIGDMNEIV